MATIADTVPSAQYTADGTQTEFFYPFRIMDSSHVVVTFDDGRAPGSHTVAGVNQDGGGTVTFDTPPPSGTRITLHRAVSTARETTFTGGAAFRAGAIDADLDRLTMMAQDARLLIERCVRQQPHDDETLDLVLPSAADRGNGVLGFDADGGIAVLPDFKTRVATTEAAADKAEQNANDAAASADDAASSATTAGNHADAAASSATDAAGSATTAANEAAAASDSASTAASEAQSAQNAASTADSHATDAGDAAARAHAWAETAEDAEVADGEYSAYHWSRKAAAELPGERKRADLRIQRVHWRAAAPGVGATPSLAFDFALGLGLDHITVARASAGTSRAPDGTPRTHGADTARIDHDPATGAPLGLLVEPERTNLLHASAAPATQTRTLAAGTYTVSAHGSGSVTVSGAASGTAQPGAPLTFTLGDQGDVTFDPDAAIARFQCEAGNLPTSFIDTPSNGPATRKADDVRVKNLGWDGGGAVVVTAHLPAVGTDQAQRLLTLEDGEPDRHNLFWNGQNSRMLLFAKAGGDHQGVVGGLIGDWAAGETHTLGFTFGTGDRRLFADGTKTGSDTITAPAGPALLRLGSFHNGGFWTGHIARVALFPASLPDAAMTALTGAGAALNGAGAALNGSG